MYAGVPSNKYKKILSTTNKMIIPINLLFFLITLTIQSPFFYLPIYFQSNYTQKKAQNAPRFNG